MWLAFGYLDRIHQQQRTQKKGNAKSLKPWSYNQSNYNSVAETMIDLRDGLCVSLFMEHGAHAKNQGISPVGWKY